jgi:hypothetical protein
MAACGVLICCDINAIVLTISAVNSKSLFVRSPDILEEEIKQHFKWSGKGK